LAVKADGMKIVSLDQDIFTFPYTSCLDCLAPLKELGCEFKAYSDQPVPTDEDIYNRIKDADIVFWGIYAIPNHVIERLNKLKILVFYGYGYENYIDEDFCRSKGIAIYNTPNYGSNTVAEYAIGLAFSLTRRICKADRRMRDADWRSQGLEGIEVAGLTFGVAGTGSIGSLVAQKASLLGANVIAFDLYPSSSLEKKYNVRYVPLDELMSTSDIVSLHINASPQTKGIISVKLIKSMKEGAFFINTARSHIVESYEPVYEMVRAGRLAGAAIDVFDGEPISCFENSRIENIITSPHIGYLTCTAMQNTLKIAVRQVLKHFEFK
jgi:D-3-phosphoglycerate dehydrogenase